MKLVQVELLNVSAPTGLPVYGLVHAVAHERL